MNHTMAISYAIDALPICALTSYTNLIFVF